MARTNVLELDGKTGTFTICHRDTQRCNERYLRFKIFRGPNFSTMATLSDYKNNLKNHVIFYYVLFLACAKFKAQAEY